MPTTFNTTMLPTFETTNFQMYEDMGILCFSVGIIAWIMLNAFNCCINPFTDKLILKLKEYETELDNAEAVISSYEEEIEMLKKNLKDLTDHYETCHKAAQDFIETFAESINSEPKTKRSRVE